MKLGDIDPVYREALATFEFFRRLGFTSDDIFLLLAGPEGQVQVNIQLHAQKKEFTVIVGFLPKTYADAQAEWVALTTAVGDGAFPDPDYARLWNESVCCQNSVAFLVALKSKGFYLPKEMS